jgi:hypothetical protein
MVRGGDISFNGKADISGPRFVGSLCAHPGGLGGGKVLGGGRGPKEDIPGRGGGPPGDLKLEFGKGGGRGNPGGGPALFFFRGIILAVLEESLSLS